jgi:hypothetical protein
MNVPEWTEKARDQLADAWVAATPDERDLIEQVVLSAERDLRDNPLGVGESRGGPYRVLMRPPLTFWYTVSPDGTRARIFRVLRPHRRSP